jgi:Glycosyltransferases involved in cell wall biogenesis
MTPLSISHLPPAPDGKTDWPWTKESKPLPPIMPDGKSWPKISIVTPSYNQGQFLEETIRSILLQDYPNLEYIIMDGGSTDNSVEIIKKYEPWLTYWVSEKDNGQSHALNKGFRKATGDLIGWQNSDDYYGVSAFAPVALAWAQNSGIRVFYGKVFLIDDNKNIVGTFQTKNTSLGNIPNTFPFLGFSNQSMFIDRKIIDNGFFLDEQFKYAMDAEFWIRLILSRYEFKYIDDCIGFFHLHPAGKSAYLQNIRLKEINKICIDLLNSSNASQYVKQIVLRGFKINLTDCFRNLYLKDFRRGFYSFIRHGGIPLLDFKLCRRFLASFLGRAILSKVFYFIKKPALKN